jgi:hypothetical protein
MRAQSAQPTHTNYRAIPPEDMLTCPRLTRCQREVVAMLRAYPQTVTVRTIAQYNGLTHQCLTSRYRKARERYLGTYDPDRYRVPKRELNAQPAPRKQPRRCGCGLLWDDKILGGHDGERLRSCARGAA